MWFRDFYPRSQPRRAKGGIKAQSKRGQFATSWWAQRWIEVLESFDIGARLGRGRSYARKGQVLSIDVAQGEVTAQVQGSRPQPYDVSIQVKELTPAEWKKALAALNSQALYLAKLLAGEMPQDVEKVFDDAGLSLFPEKLGDLKTSCSCPDYSNPCKHIAAVYYLLGEEFDRDPFLIFQLRGLSREDLMKRLQPSAAGKAKSSPAAARPAAEPLPSDVQAFWSVGETPGNLVSEVQPPPVAAAWPKRLGNFPFWRGADRFLETLEPIYRQASERGLRALATEPGESRTAEE
jgi:uncharacterized Zn finger protein